MLKYPTEQLKKRAENLYEKSFKYFVSIVGNKSTYDEELNKVGKKHFKKKFKGVFSSDNIPILKNKEMLIANLDEESGPGSHWVAVAKENDILWVYDSFGRDIHEILPSIYKGKGNVKSTERDVEQKLEEDNCGARCLAFLSVFHKYGSKLAKYI